MATSDTKYRDLLPVIVETSGAQMPDGFDSWGIKSARPDLATTHGYWWASPGGVNISNEHLERGNGGACPKVRGDGLCVATTWRGMASGGIPARTLLLVAYRAADVVGRDDSEGKLRIGGKVASVALIDGERLIREHGRGADLRRSCLRGACLRGADLRGADLHGADLRGADLHGADLQGADLSDADISDADISDTDLSDADLRYADLWRAGLSDADLRGANLQGAFWPGSTATPDGWALTDDGSLTREATR